MSVYSALRLTSKILRLDVKIRPVGKMVFTSGIYGDKIYGKENKGLIFL